MWGCSESFLLPPPPPNLPPLLSLKHSLKIICIIKICSSVILYPRFRGRKSVWTALSYTNVGGSRISLIRFDCGLCFLLSLYFPWMCILCLCVRLLLSSNLKAFGVNDCSGVIFDEKRILTRSCSALFGRWGQNLWSALLFFWKKQISQWVKKKKNCCVTPAHNQT